MTISPHPTQTVRGAEAVLTNGEGQRTTAHLNLERSLSDFWTMAPEPPLPAVRTIAVTPRPALRRSRNKPATMKRPMPFAGYDATERGWK